MPFNDTPDMTPLKQCSKCREWKPANKEFFHKTKDDKDGFGSSCKSCRKAFLQANYEKYAKQRSDRIASNKERNKGELDRNGEKLCSHCHQIKSLREFGIKRETRDGHETSCKKCRAERNGYKYHPAPKPGYKRCSRCCEELPATNENFGIDKRRNYFSSRCKSCARIAATEWAKKHPEKMNERSTRWIQARPETSRSNLRRRRARKRNLPDNFTSKDWQRALDYFKGCCAVCERPMNGLFHTAHADHWLPLSSPECLGTVPGNIVPLCGGAGGCNQSKNNKPATEWLVSKFGKRKASVILARVETYFASLASHPDKP